MSVNMDVEENLLIYLKPLDFILLTIRRKYVLEMSILRQYRVIDLAIATENLMNILYVSEWKEDFNTNSSDDFLFKKIKSMHMHIMKDSEIQYTPNKSQSQLFEIANRISTIQNSLTGYTETIPSVLTVRILIDKTNRLIESLSSERREFCVIC